MHFLFSYKANPVSPGNADKNGIPRTVSFVRKLIFCVEVTFKSTENGQASLSML